MTGHAGSHNSAATQLGRELPGWVWWHTEKPHVAPYPSKILSRITQPLIKTMFYVWFPNGIGQIAAHDTVYATGYRRTRNGTQQLELRFDGIAGCLRTPEGGSSKQYLVVKKNGPDTRAAFDRARGCQIDGSARTALNFPEVITTDIKRWAMQWLRQSHGL